MDWGFNEFLWWCIKCLSECNFRVIRVLDLMRTVQTNLDCFVRTICSCLLNLSCLSFKCRVLFIDKRWKGKKTRHLCKLNVVVSNHQKSTTQANHALISCWKYKTTAATLAPLSALYNWSVLRSHLKFWDGNPSSRLTWLAWESAHEGAWGAIVTDLWVLGAL